MHDGFERAACRFFDYIRDRLLLHGTRRTIITGHSRGGALAAVVVSMLGRYAGDLLTFGAPAQGGAEYIKRLRTGDRGNRIAFVHGADCVPDYPPAAMGYVHGLPTVYLPAPAWHSWPIIRRYWRIRDHLPESYGPAVREFIRTAPPPALCTQT